MTTQEMIAVITAFEQGKKIEYSNKSHSIRNWKQDNPVWNFAIYDYRIVEEPEYVPYDGTQEGTLVGKIVVSKSTHEIFMVVGEDKTDASRNLLIGADEDWVSYGDFFKYYQFLDGTPCGMLKK
jgi:hypothetical protein